MSESIKFNHVYNMGSPDSGFREKRKFIRKFYSDIKRNGSGLDNTSVYSLNEKDFCDCLCEECPGCHFPCPKCRSCNCGVECRYRCREKVIEKLEEVIKRDYLQTIANGH